MSIITRIALRSLFVFVYDLEIQASLSMRDLTRHRTAPVAVHVCLWAAEAGARARRQAVDQRARAYYIIPCSIFY